MKDENEHDEHDEHGEQQRRGRGRPALYSNAAERQRAYRERMKRDGKRVISRVVRDVRDDTQRLTSDVIDLSEVRPPWRAS